MKGKINLKTIIIFAILILAIVLSVLGVNVAKNFMSGATADYEPQGLTAVSSADGSTATVSWTTDKEVKASVFYGTSAASTPLMAIESASSTDHNVLLSGLKPNKTYYYKIVAGDGEYLDEGEIPYTFKTSGKSEEAVATVAPTLAPVVTLPESSSPSSASSSTTCSHTTDYNKDGVINSFDYMACLKEKVTPTTAASKI